MATFFCKLNPPRPQFALGMTPDEMTLMQAHAGYWEQWRSKGHVKAFGLVADPTDPYGIGIVEFDDEGAVRSFTTGDPVIKANRGFRYDIFAMPMGA
jgi:hypothetical protein